MITPPSKLQAIAATPTQNTRSNTNIEHVIQPNDNRNRKPSRLHPPKTQDQTQTLNTRSNTITTAMKVKVKQSLQSKAIAATSNNDDNLQNKSQAIAAATNNEFNQSMSVAESKLYQLYENNKMMDGCPCNKFKKEATIHCESCNVFYHPSCIELDAKQITKIKCVSEMCWCPRCEAESIFVVRQAGCNRGSSNNPSSKSQAIAVTPTQNTRSNTNIEDNAEEKEIFAPMNVPGTKQRLIQYIRTRTNTNFRYEILRNQLDFDQAFSMFEDMPFHQRCLSFFGRKYLLMLASVDYIDLDHRQAVNILWVFSVLEIYIEISIAFLHLWPELKIKTQ
eukprot:385409_1